MTDPASDHPLSLAAGTVLDCGPVDTVSVAAGAGFDHVGIWVDLADWTPNMSATVRERLDATGLSVLDAEVIRLRPHRATDDALRLLDIAAEIGAANALVVSQDPDRPRTVAQYRQLCEHGAVVGVRPVIEFMRFMTVRTLDDALEVVTAADHPVGAVLIDALHLARCGVDPDRVTTIDRALLPYAQLCDAPLASPPAELLVDEALNLRLLPGDGELPLSELVAVFAPGVPFSMEIRSASLVADHPDPNERATIVAQASRRMLEVGRGSS